MTNNKTVSTNQIRREQVWTRPTTVMAIIRSRAKARVLMGNESASEVYEAAGRGDLDLVKDGAKTLVMLSSIERYMAALPRAQVRKYPPQPAAIRRRGPRIRNK
jgi:hypothetical protein